MAKKQEKHAQLLRPLETFSSAASSCNPCSAFCATALGASNHGEEAG